MSPKALTNGAVCDGGFGKWELGFDSPECETRPSHQSVNLSVSECDDIESTKKCTCKPLSFQDRIERIAFVNKYSEFNLSIKLEEISRSRT